MIRSLDRRAEPAGVYVELHGLHAGPGFCAATSEQNNAEKEYSGHHPIRGGKRESETRSLSICSKHTRRRFDGVQKETVLFLENQVKPARRVGDGNLVFF